MFIVLLLYTTLVQFKEARRWMGISGVLEAMLSFLKNPSQWMIRLAYPENNQLNSPFFN